MNIKVEITLTNTFNTTSNAVIESINMDNDIISSGVTSEIEEVIRHVHQALIGIGYSTTLLEEYFNVEK